MSRGFVALARMRRGVACSWTFEAEDAPYSRRLWGFDWLEPFEEFGIADAETFHYPLERVETKVAMAFFDIGEIATIDAGHERKFFLGQVVLNAQFFNAQPDFVSDFRLFHSRRLLTVLYCYV